MRPPTLTIASDADSSGLAASLQNERQLGNRCCAHSVSIIPSPNDPAAPAPREGREALRFELRYDDPEAAFTSKRAEITLDGVAGDLGQIGGPSEWYSFSIFLPASHQPDPSAEIVAQWHATPDEGEVFRGPVLSLHSRDGQWQIIGRHSGERIQQNSEVPELRLWQAPYRTGVWTDFIFRTRWDWHIDGQGLVSAWIRPSTAVHWQPIVNYQGPIGYRDEGAIYFKAGLYKWPWEGCRTGDAVEICSGAGSPVASTVERRIVYLDAVHAVSGNGVDFEQFAEFFP